jgi:hypothetical protein
MHLTSLQACTIVPSDQLVGFEIAGDAVAIAHVESETFFHRVLELVRKHDTILNKIVWVTVSPVCISGCAHANLDR